MSEDDEPYCGDCYDEKFAFCDDCGAELERGAPGTTPMPNGEWYCEDCEPHVCSECDDPIKRGEEHDCDGNTLCEQCFDEKCAGCGSCGTVGFADDMVYAFDEYWCEKCAPPPCDSCGEYMSEDDMYHTDYGVYCESCYEVEVEQHARSMWADFYSKNPDLQQIDALQKAADEEGGIPPDVYVRIFRDLDWEDGYGGDAWAHIAETWRDLKSAAKAEDWAKMHLLIDHAFDLVHNTGSLFTKASSDVQSWLFKALEEKFFLDPLQYRDKLSASARKLLDLHIRYSGGVAKWKEHIATLEGAMDKFVRAFRESDGRMAKRVWDMFDMKPDMFRGRDGFLEAAYYSEGPSFPTSRTVADLRGFLGSPGRESFLRALDAVSLSMCDPGSQHPASSVIRDEFLPKAVGLLETDDDFRRMFEQAKQSTEQVAKLSQERRLLFPLYQRSTILSWGERLRAAKRRRDEESKESPITAALRVAFLRLALSRADFYDFYALSVVECGKFPDDVARMCAGLKKVTALHVAKALLTILERAVTREARHVGRHLSME